VKLLTMVTLAMIRRCFRVYDSPDRAQNRGVAR
jgi:hypothetical protein